MAAHGAYRLARMNKNLGNIIAVEMLCASQGVEFRAPLTTSDRLHGAISRLRQDVEPLDKDRYMADDIARAASLVVGDDFAAAADCDLAL